MIQALSHLEVDPSAVTVSHLILGIAGQELSSPEYIRDWDYSTPLNMRAEIVVDLDVCLESAGLGNGSELGLSVVWHASGSGLRGASDTQVVIDGLNTVNLDFDGGELGGTLALVVIVTMLSRSDESGALAAKRPGSRLWETELRVRLEGSGSRFPISHVSFAESGLAGGLQAAWLLLFESPNLYDSGVGNMRLYLNTDHPAVKEFVENPDDRADLAEVLRADVNRQITLQALQSEELEVGSMYPNDSMGELLSMAFKRNFPGRSIDEVRALARNSPGEFEAHLQARGGFLA